MASIIFHRGNMPICPRHHCYKALCEYNLKWVCVQCENQQLDCQHIYSYSESDVIAWLNKKPQSEMRNCELLWVDIVFSFCPLCGKRLQQQAQENNGQK